MTISPNAARAYQFFLEQGFAPHQAAGIVGNFKQESGTTLRTDAVGDGGNSFGIAQWNGPRRRALEAFAAQRGASATDLDTQLAFVMHEFGTTERRAAEALRAAGDVTSATEAFSRLYERPGDPRMENRLRYAAAVAGVDPSTLPGIAETRGTETRGTDDKRPTADASKPDDLPPEVRALMAPPGGAEAELPPEVRALLGSPSSLRPEPSTFLGVDTGAFGRGFVQGGTMGAPDEVAGLLAAEEGRQREAEPFSFRQMAGDMLYALPGFGPMIAGGLMGPEGAYEAGRDAYRADDAAARERAPGSFMGGEITGALASGVATAPMFPASAVTGFGRAGQAAFAGGATGAAYGFGSGEGGAGNRIAGGVGGGIIGAVGGVVGREILVGAGKVFNALVLRGIPVTLPTGEYTPAAQNALRAAGLDPSRVPIAVAKAFEERAARSAIAPDTARRAAADEFGIPLTRGQATGDSAEQAFEAAAIAGGRGEGAGRVARGFDDLQRRQTTDAVKNIVPSSFADPFEAAGAVQRGLAGARQRSAAEVRAAYDAVPRGTVIAAGAFDDLTSRLGALRDDPVFMASGMGEAALRTVEKLISRVQRTPDAIGLDLVGVEQARKALNRLMSQAIGDGNRGSAREIGTVVRELDDWIDQSVSSALISGDEGALAAVKAARERYADFRSRFTQRAGKIDPGGRAVEMMTDPDLYPDGIGPGPQEVVNWLFGASQVGADAVSRAAARRVGSILGKDSPEWAALRQGAWQRVYGGTRAANGEGAPAQFGPAALSSRILDFTNGPGRGLARELFSAEEIATMNRLANVLRMLPRDGRMANPSGTGAAVGRMISDLSGQLTTMLGVASGNPVAGFSATFLSKALGDRALGRRAMALFDPSGARLAPDAPRPGAGTGAAGGGAGAAAAVSGVPVAGPAFDAARGRR